MLVFRVDFNVALCSGTAAMQVSIGLAYKGCVYTTLGCHLNSTVQNCLYNLQYSRSAITTRKVFAMAVRVASKLAWSGLLATSRLVLFATSSISLSIGRSSF